MPHCVAHVWNWFIRLSNRRGGGFGPAPLTHSDMQAFFALTGQRPTPFEVEMIEALDSRYLAITAERTKEQT